MRRIFIGLPVPAEKFEFLISELESKNWPLPKFKKPGADGAHLTLAFLGNLNDIDFDRLMNSKAYFPPMRAFDLIIDRIGVFPYWDAAKVLWAGPGGPCPNKLTSLQKEVGEQLKELGLSYDERDFKAHITLARTSKPWNGKAYESESRIQGLKLNFNSYCIYESKAHGEYVRLCEISA